MTWRSLMLVFAATLALARTTSTNIIVTSYLSDLSPSGAAYYIQSDGQAGPVHRRKVIALRSPDK